jgi:hypothetical protein
MWVDAGSIVAVLCYAVLLAFRVDVGHRRSVPLSAAFAPVVALMGRGSMRATVVLVVLGAIAGLASSAVVRRGWSAAAFDLSAFVLSFAVTRGALLGVETLAVPEGVMLVLSGAMGVLSFAAAEVAYAFLMGFPSLTREERRVCFVLYALLGSAFGLTILVDREIGSVAFLAVVLPLVMTKREFDQYALAKSTLEETVGVLEQLEARSL